MLQICKTHSNFSDKYSKLSSFFCAPRNQIFLSFINISFFDSVIKIQTFTVGALLTESKAFTALTSALFS